jgi:hypothetical protein
MLADQPVIPSNCSLMMTRYPRNTADRGFFHAIKGLGNVIPVV